MIVILQLFFRFAPLAVRFAQPVAGSVDNNRKDRENAQLPNVRSEYRQFAP
jgi:hypothetical protein